MATKHPGLPSSTLTPSRILYCRTRISAHGKKCPTSWRGIFCHEHDTIGGIPVIPGICPDYGSEFGKGFPDSCSGIAPQFKDIPSLSQFPDRHLQAIFSVKYLMTARQYLTTCSVIYR